MPLAASARMATLPTGRMTASLAGALSATVTAGTMPAALRMLPAATTALWGILGMLAMLG
jgi:hypothetical protein